MNKMLKVAQYEYKRHVYRRRFWIALVAMPLGVLLLFGLSMFFSVSSADKRPIGFLDQAGIIQSVPIDEKGGLFSDPKPQLLAYKDESAARAALDEGKVQAYFIVPAAYTSTYKVDYIFDKPISSSIQREISALLRDSLLQGQTIPNKAAIDRGTEFTFQTLDGSKSSTQYDWLKIFVPMIIGMLFFITVMMSGTYLIQAVVEEKENRTMEVMITSTSPNDLIAGKIIGNMGVGLTQLFLWVVFLVIAGFLFRDKLGFLAHLNLDWKFVTVSIIFMLLGYISICAMMGMMGATVTNTQESQQMTGLVVLPMMLPYYLMYSFMTNPNGLIPRILTFFPVSSPIAMSMRMAFGTVPVWEVLASGLILLAFGIFAIWLAGKAFRLGMLRYDKKIPLKQLFRKEASHG